MVWNLGLGFRKPGLRAYLGVKEIGAAPEPHQKLTQ